MACGGGKIHSLVLLMGVMALLALFTVTHAQSLNEEVVSTFGSVERCCGCVCDRRAPQSSMCACSGTWKGGCPSVCSECNCDENNMCTCGGEGFNIKFYDCQKYSCSSDGTSIEGM